MELWGAVPLTEEWTPVDRALYSFPDAFMVDEKRADELRLAAVRYSFGYHYKHNRFYRSFCDQRRVAPGDVKALEDLAEIPLIPDTIFKGCRSSDEFISWLVSISSDEMEYPPPGGLSGSYQEMIKTLWEKHGIKVAFTGGTSGKISFFPIDAHTRRRRIHFDLISSYSISSHRHHIQDLCKVSLYTRSWRGSGLASPSNYFPMIEKVVSPEVLEAALRSHRPIDEKLGERLREEGEDASVLGKVAGRLAETLKELKVRGGRGEIESFPFMLHRILDRFEEEAFSFDLGSKWSVITAGGWKIGESERLPEEKLRKRVTDLLGIPDENIRDNYVSTEHLGYIGFSCEGHYKHIHYKLTHPFILNENLEPLPYGERGRFAFLNPIPTSYPAFIMTGDTVKILERCPRCDRQGPVFEPEIRRMEAAEDRGCAMVVRRLMEEGLLKS